MKPPAEHIGKARRSLAGGLHSLAGGFTEQAGREAYLAAFHAAQAFTVSRTGKQPKTHSGARSEFARLAREEPRINPRFVAFLANAFELKTWADYDGDEPISQAEALAALGTATEMVEVLTGLV